VPWFPGCSSPEIFYVDLSGFKWFAIHLYRQDNALASKKRRVVKVDFVNDCVWMFESAGGLKQNLARQCMATVQAVKVLLATCPRALLRSTLTAWTSAMERF